MIKTKAPFIVACCVSMLFASTSHAAQSADPAANYPNKPIRLIVPFAPGAGTDTTARTIALKLSEKELIAHAKANPGKLNFGSSGTGTLQHFSGELFNHQAGIKIVHVPYKGTAAVIPAMLAGEVQVGFGSLIGTRAQMQANRVRGLAISAKKRSPAIELPTVAESGLPTYEVDQWYGIIAPAKVPKPIISKLNGAIVEALKQPDVAHRLASDGSIPVGSSPEQFTAHIRSEIAKWKRLVKDANLQLHQ